MPGPTPQSRPGSSPDAPGALDATSAPAKRLGAVLRARREAQGVSAAGLARRTRLSRSYITYLESGKFADIGLDKFARIIQALDLTSEEILREAGYLPATKAGLPEPASYFRAAFGLSPAGAAQVAAFTEFLAERERKPPGGATSGIGKTKGKKR